MFVITGLILVPVVVALVLLLIKNDKARIVLVAAAAVTLTVLALVLAVQYFFMPSVFVVPEVEIINHLVLVISLVCGVYIIYRGIRASKYLVVALAVLQCALAIVYDIGFPAGATVSSDLYVDQLSIIMALVIAVIGGGICVYALGYMRDYQEHQEDKGRSLAASDDPTLVDEALKLVRDRRHIFFALLFVFLGAMFALVFANRLSWFYAAWEVTTVCSFALIGFSRSAEAQANAFKAVTINLIGGLALVIALIIVASEGYHIFELDTLIAAASGGTMVLPVVLIAFAGMTKAAQMPFQGWLLGAMVAPTPVSALLHSSTMVKAGVFILIKLAPAFGWNIPGLFVVVIGGLTFLCCSALAISQSNAKRVLAYSTVANLGLITCCAGIGTPEAVWAAIFLLIFHAIAKALLFCCVGTAEHHLGSRDIEAMDNIFIRMPWIATCIALGILAMFIAPFGMLISKWAMMVALAQSGHLELLFVLAFGSALTFVFWAKWLGKTLAVGNESDRITTKVSLLERASLAFMAFLLLAVTLALPYISDALVLPYLEFTGTIFQLSTWIIPASAIGYENLIIMNVILMLILLLLVVQILRKKPVPNDTVYLAGVGIDSEERSYRNSLSQVSKATQRNWYMEQVFGERALGRPAMIVVSSVLALFFILGIVAELMLL